MGRMYSDGVYTPRWLMDSRARVSRRMFSPWLLICTFTGSPSLPRSIPMAAEKLMYWFMVRTVWRISPVASSTCSVISSDTSMRI